MGYVSAVMEMQTCLISTIWVILECKVSVLLFNARIIDLKKKFLHVFLSCWSTLKHEKILQMNPRMVLGIQIVIHFLEIKKWMDGWIKMFYPGAGATGLEDGEKAAAAEM